MQGNRQAGTRHRSALRAQRDRVINREALRAELEVVFTQHDTEPLCDRLLSPGLPAGPVQSIDKALPAAHTVHRGDVVEKDWYKGVASPVRFDRSKASLRRMPPKFSQHAAEVLAEFGYSRSRSTDLVAQGVVCASAGAGQACSSGRARAGSPGHAA